jgi:hypothetical protein
MLLDVNTSAQPTEVKGGDNSMSVLFDACQGPSRADPGIWRGAAVAGVEMLTYAACPIKEV